MELDATRQVEWQPSDRVSGSLWQLSIGGGVAFWATTFGTSLLPVAAELRAAASISWLPMVLVESLIGGIVIGCVVGYCLLRFGDAVPSTNPIFKSVILAGLALVAVTMIRSVGRTGAADDWHWFVVGAVLDVPRFLVLGTAIGYLYKRQRGSAS